MTTEQNANLAPTDKSSTTFSANISRTIFLKSFCAELTEEQEKTYNQIFETFRDGLIDSKNN